MKPDNELLRQYAGSHSEEAFTELVRRHVNLVYSAALRQVGGDAHLAHDAAQNVFTDLARKADSLSRRDSLTGWLYTSAYFAANKIARTEIRRRQREEQFMREPTRHAASEVEWEKLRPALDSVMHELNETDREAVLLRYFENRAFADVGSKLNLNENAARMRVERALEKLRTLLAKRGITTGGALAAIISANAVQTAPGTLATSLASASLASSTMGKFTLFKTMNTLKFKIGAGALAIAGAVTLMVNHNIHATARIQNVPTQQIAQAQAVPETVSDASPSGGTYETVLRNRTNQPMRPAAETVQTNAENLAAPQQPRTTNAAVETNKVVVKLVIKIITLSADALQALRPAWPGGDSAILTADQLKFIGRTLPHQPYSETDSTISAFSGQQAIIGVHPPVQLGDTNASIETLFGVTPYYSPESSIFRLNLFFGFYSLGDSSSTAGLQPMGQTNEFTVSAGQVAVLRRDLPGTLAAPDNSSGGAKQVLVFVAAEIGDASDAPRPASNQSANDKAKFAKMAEAKEGLLALIVYANKNQGQIPPTFAQAASYVKNGGAETIEADYDLVYSGPISAITNTSETILLREKQATQGSNGKWMRNYGFADGHVQIVSEPTNDFEAFEKAHMVTPGG